MLFLHEYRKAYVLEVFVRGKRLGDSLSSLVIPGIWPI